MRRLLILGGTFAAALTASVSCGQPMEIIRGQLPPADSSVHSVKLSPDSVKLKPGDGWQLSFALDAGAGVSLRTVKWSSSNRNVAAVTESGMVTAGDSAGVATITATSNADTTAKGTSKIVVIQP